MHVDVLFLYMIIRRKHLLIVWIFSELFVKRRRYTHCCVALVGGKNEVERERQELDYYMYIFAFSL